MLTKLIVVLAAIATGQCHINSTAEIISLSVPIISDKSTKELPLEVHEKIYSYTKNAKAFKNLTFEETVAYMNDLYAWEPDQDIREGFSYSHWGYDFEKRPVWSEEIGKQDWRGIVEQGQARADMLERYLLKSAIHVIRSMVKMDSPGEEIRKGVFIWDMDGFNMRYLTHLPTVAAGVRLATRYGDLAQMLAGRVYLINANYVTKLAADLARPLLGRLLESVEVYGSNRNIWLPRLLKILPQEIIPPAYGGNKDFKPLGVYG